MVKLDKQSEAGFSWVLGDGGVLVGAENQYFWLLVLTGNISGVNEKNDLQEHKH